MASFLDPVEYRVSTMDHVTTSLLLEQLQTLPGLVTTSALEHAVREVERKAEQSYVMQTDHNIYLTKEDWDTEKARDHVANRRLDTKVAALSCDLLRENCPLKILFKSDSFLNFIRKILNVPALYRNVDPIGAVFVNIYKVKAHIIIRDISRRLNISENVLMWLLQEIN